MTEKIPERNNGFTNPNRRSFRQMDDDARWDEFQFGEQARELFEKRTENTITEDEYVEQRSLLLKQMTANTLKHKLERGGNLDYASEVVDGDLSFTLFPARSDEMYYFNGRRRYYGTLHSLGAKREKNDEIIPYVNQTLGSSGPVFQYASEVFEDGRPVGWNTEWIVKDCPDHDGLLEDRRQTLHELEEKGLIHNLTEFSMDKKAEVVEQRISEIIKKLDLSDAYNEDQQLRNACLLEKYLATNINYDISIQEEKRERQGKNHLEEDLYDVLERKRGVCTSVAMTFNEILSRLNIDVFNVYCESKESGNAHMANLVLIGSEYYYFDATLENSIYKKFGEENNKFFLSTAALGRNTYEDYYDPKCIIKKDISGCIGIPDNVSERDIDKVKCNEMVGISLE